MDTIRLIASDLDATLLDDQIQLPPDFAETVCALAQKGKVSPEDFTRVSKDGLRHAAGHLFML